MLYKSRDAIGLDAEYKLRHATQPKLNIEQNDDYIKNLTLQTLTMQTSELNMKEKVQEVWGKKPLIISGPCSAETEDQLVATAQRLAATGKVDMLRAGIWKPRTKPGMFEGIGAKGLPWLQKAKALRYYFNLI